MGYINVKWDPSLAATAPKAGEVPKYNEDGMLLSASPIIDEKSDVVSTTLWVCEKLKNELADAYTKINQLQNVINTLISSGGVEFGMDSNNILDARLTPDVSYIASQITAGNLDYDTIVTKYPDIKDELDALI